MASPGRILGWTVGTALALAAAGLAVWMLGGEAPAPPAGEVAVEVITRDAQPGPARVLPELPSEPAPATGDKRPSGTPDEQPAAQAGVVVGRITTADRRVMHEGRVEALRGSNVGMQGLTQLRPLQLAADVGTDGRFRIEGLPAVDDLVLRVDGATFATTQVGTFLVQPGRTTDLGDVIVSAGMDVVGRVVDDRNRPVGGARVSLFEGDRGGTPPGESERPARLVLSDEQGRFRIGSVPIGSFSVLAAADGYASGRTNGGVLPGDQPGSVSVTLTLGRARPLRGVVLGLPEREPLAGALVRATALDANLVGGSAVTDSAGRFELTDVAWGNYVVEASLQGWSVGRDRTWTERNDFEVQIGLEKQGSLRGVVVGEDGEPVTSFDLQPQHHHGKLDPAQPAGPFQRIANSDGRFELHDLEPGFTCVQVWAKGYALTVSDCFRVRRGEDVVGVVVQLVRGATLEGLAMDDRGKPVAGAKVSLFQNHEPEIPFLRGTSGRPAMLKDTRTSADGRFVLRDLTGMTYQVEVDHPDFAIVRRNDVVVAPSTGNRTEPFLLERSARLEGVAVSASGQIQAGATVQLTQVGKFARETVSDGNGHFVFTRLPAGDYLLTCLGRAKSFTAMIAAAAHPPPAFRIESGQTLTRNVVSPD